MRTRLACVLALASIFTLVVPSSSTADVFGTDVTYTTDADFDQGTLVSVNHDAPNGDQLQLNTPTEPFPFINVAASGRGTVVRVNTDTGATVGEYRTAPQGRGLDPSRTTVDLFGNVWTANRGEFGEIDGVPHGSAVKIGLIVGGTRADATGQPDPTGGYVAPPFGYNTCVDRNGDGLIRTSGGLHDVLDWPDVIDGVGGADGIVEDALDECVLLYQRLPDAEQARHVSVDANNDVWVGGFPFEQRQFHRLGGSTAAIIESFDARQFGCGGYGGLVDGDGVLWSIGWGTGEGPLLRYDPATSTGSCVNTFGGYGLGIDINGYVWASIWENYIVKVSPDGIVEPGFPATTWLPPATTTAGGSAPSMAFLNAMLPAPRADDAPEAAPDFWLAPDDDWVQSMNPWTPGAMISLTIEDGSGVIHTDSQTAGGDGNFNFNMWEVFDLQRGHLVTVSDGTTTKTHDVTDLFVDGLDVVADTVFGRADAGTDVDVWVHQDGSNLTVTADGFGNWVADFSATTDLDYGSDGGSQQVDADGDATGVWWSGPTFTAAPDDDWVGSTSRWTPGSTVSLTIEDGSGVIYADSQMVDAGGNFNFNMWEVFDVQRGHIVTVSDGTVTKSHVVIGYFVDGVDAVADTVFGRAEPGTDVHVWVHQGDSQANVTADGSGNWVADFSAQTDLTYLSDGNSQQVDDDGDATWVFWASPRFSASPDHDWVGSMTRWTPGSTVSLTVDDGSGVVYADSQTVDAIGNFNFDLNGVFDVERGFVVTVSDGTVTKSHQVIELFVDTVDIAADTVSGRGIVGTSVDVWVHGDGNVTVLPDGSGGWTADFSGLADLTYGVEGDSQQLDDDGDGTTAPWSVRNPTIVVYRDQGFMRGDQFEPLTTVTITVNTGVVGTTFTDEEGTFWFDHPFDVGQEVAADDGTTVKSHVVTSHTIGAVDHVGNTASGTAMPLSWVTVEVSNSPTNLHRELPVDASGVWFTDFDVPDGSGLTDDITPFTPVNVWQTDDDGDNTTVTWQLPRFNVNVDDNSIDGGPWARNAIVTVSVDGVPLDPVPTDQYGNFGIGTELDLVPGQLVSVVGPENTKTLLISGVEVTDVDTVLDTISGVATPGAELEISVQEFDRPVARKATADLAGLWMVDFSVPATDPTNDEWENQAWDVTAYTRGWVDEWDDDGDATVKQFGPPVQANRGVAVTPVDNHVWVANSGVGTVTRLDNDGNIVAVIETGDQPTGVAVDAAGKVWVTNLGSDNTVRIDPNAGADGLGAVDLTVDLGEGAGPYNYSDMTGAVVVGSTSPQGFWTTVQDSGEAGFEWGRITWNTEPEASEPAGSAIVVEARTADTEAGLGAEVFTSVSNGELFSSLGRFIEVRMTLKASPEGLSPVLSDIRVQPAVIDVDIDIKPGSYPNTIRAKRITGVVPVAVLGSADFDVMSIDVMTLRFGPDLALPSHDLTVVDGHYEDIDRDGFLDLVSHYVVGDVGLVLGDTESCLSGATLGGIPIEGCDSVRMR